MDFIMSPIAIYAALGISVLVCFVLFLMTSLDGRRRDRKYSTAMSEMKEEISTLREQMEAFAAKATEPEEAPVALPAAPLPGSSMNLTRRAQALRLHRLGIDPTEIARRLGLAQGEVRLAVKMHKMLVEHSTGA